MKNLALVLPILFLSALAASAVKTTDIESVRLSVDGTSAELTPSDKSTIQSFWQRALNTMLLTEDTQEIVEIRRQIEQQKSSQPLSSYAAAFNAAALDYLKIAFDNIDRIEDPDRQQLLQQNLMVLAANLQTPQLVPIAIECVNDKDPVVRYWAVKAMANAGVIQTLSDEIMGDEEMKATILDALKQRVEYEQQAEIQTMIIRFCAAVNHPTAREILLAIADQRAAAYLDWSVTNEIMDAKLLIALGSTAMMQEDGGVKAEFAGKFAALYSLVFQRYMLGQDVLTDAQIAQAISVIAEVDRTILAKMLNVTQTGVLRALQQKRGLDREFETIFGDRMRAGDLATIYNFDYGKDADGKGITAPPTLSMPAGDGTDN